MICPKCGANNIDGSSFCIKCGLNLKETINPTPIVNEPTYVSEQNVNTQVNNNVNYMNNTTNNSNNSKGVKTSIKDYISPILAVITNPSKTINEDINNFNEFKDTAIMSLIVSLGITLLNLITTMINTVIVKSYSFFGESTKTTIKLERLKDLNYLELIGKNFLIYLGIIFLTGGIYYLASLIIKKNASFTKLLGKSLIALTPMLISLVFLSPILSLIWSYLGILITLIGLMFTVIILYESMTKELSLEGNTKYYLNLSSLSIIGIGLYIVYMKVMLSSVSNGLGNFLDLF